MAVPYYSDDHVTIYHGDCREVTEWLSGDVMVTDPPYGISQGVYGARRDGRSRIVTPSARVEVVGDTDTMTRDAALLLWGTTRAGLVFGSWRAPRPENVRARLLWLKRSTKTCLGGTPWSPADEEIYVLGGGWSGPTTLNYLETTETRDGSGGLAAQVGHPTPKPVGLMRWLIERTPSGLIVDPFMGSGSTLRAAKDLGRRAIGVELDERYCEIAARRMGQEVLDFGGAA